VGGRAAEADETELQEDPGELQQVPARGSDHPSPPARRYHTVSILPRRCYHFANLWFAGDRKNWPLARFCFDETRSHLRWAVRIIPVRKSPTGEDLDMKSLLDAVDNGLLAEVGKTIDARDRERFVTTYRQALEGCYSCHKAAGKPYLRPQIPAAPAAPILNFDPEAKWPQ
jgi:hypothetical protein